METKGNIELLYDITMLVKDFYETPVIFVTRKDYSAFLFNTFCSLRESLKKDDRKQTIELIVDFHLQWLNAVTDIENFKIKLDSIDNIRRCMEQFSTFTNDAITFRFQNYRKYIENQRYLLEAEDQSNLQSDFEIVEEMHTEMNHILLSKLATMQKIQTDLECKVRINAAADELLQWIDTLSDALVVKLSKYIHINNPHLIADLTKTLQQIVDDLISANTEAGQRMLDSLKKKGSQIGSMIRFTAGHNLQRSKVYDKIITLEDRIKRLGAADVDEPSAAILALTRKKEYLEKRLQSLENLKTTLREIQKTTSISVEDLEEEDLCVCEDFYQLRIFNHNLPVASRERLITELCHIWDSAIFGEHSDKSIISILSAAELKEEFYDEHGTFYIDEYSRKIYKSHDGTLYQPNEHSKLVPVSDDADHIYFYDECGRYFVHPQTRQRIYKAHAAASEYIMDSSGVLLKVKEVRDEVEYYYDNYGRYYIDRDGKHIYRDADSISEYENDGLGNLVRIRSHLDLFDPCPGDANVTEDFRYLKEVVGKALRECLGLVLLQQPSDPIKYLSACLIKYRENLELRDKRARDGEELNQEREVIAAEERAAAERAAMEAALLMTGGSEASFDSNLIKYHHSNADDAISVGHSSK